MSFFPFALIPTPASYAKKTAAQRREEKGSREIAPSSIVRGPEKRKKNGQGGLLPRYSFGTLPFLFFLSATSIFEVGGGGRGGEGEARGHLLISLSTAARGGGGGGGGGRGGMGGGRGGGPRRHHALLLRKMEEEREEPEKRGKEKKEDWRWCFARLFFLFLPPRSRAIPASLYCHYPSCQEHEFITVAALVFPSPLFLTPFRQSLPLSPPPPLAVLLRLGERRSHAKQTMHLLFHTQYADKRASFFFGGGL